uniref:Selenoprotein P n=1 Tax=Seriola lalandi dorsalis TaxID=1841481 RepID=A0A3B4Y4J6_SERLL
MVINHQGEEAQRLHAVLAQRLAENITLYKQEEQQPDVWQTLSGEKDDFLIYDRCGRLTHHISLPYSIIGQGHVEGAIKDTYCKRICGNCTHEPGTDGTPAVEEDTGHGHGHDLGHGHHHGHHHGRGDGHHGHNHGFHPRGFGHGRDHGTQGQEQDSGVFQGQQQAELGQMQQAVQVHLVSQEANGAPVRP